MPSNLPDFLKSKSAAFDEAFPDLELKETVRFFLSSSLKEAYVLGLEAAKGAIPPEMTHYKDCGAWRARGCTCPLNGWNAHHDLVLANLDALLKEVEV